VTQGSSSSLNEVTGLLIGPLFTQVPGWRVLGSSNPIFCIETRFNSHSNRCCSVASGSELPPALHTSHHCAECRGSSAPALSQLAWAHAHETLLWASKGGRSHHTFNYDLSNSTDPSAQISSVWSIPSVPKKEKLHGYHPTQKPLRLVRRAILTSTREGDLVFDPFCGSGTSGVASKKLG
jgi:hypothetical protein